MIRSLLLMSTALAAVAAGPAFADEYGSANHGQITVQQAASMMAYSAGNDQARVSIAPNWSEELGWSVRASAGSYLGDAVALGTIIEHGANKQEYLANFGLQLSETLSLIGTIGQLAEHKEFIAEEGEDKASQMEYGLSLKGHLQDGLGFEFNGYAVNSKAINEDIETAKLYGTEALATLGLADSTLLKIGGGYEWLEWDGGEKDNRWTFRTEANHQLTDKLGLQGHSKIGASERSYGGGLNFSLSNDGTNLLGLNYTQIDGRHGVADDKRVELSWTYGLGAGSSSKIAASETTDDGRTISAAADVAMLAPASNLLGDVMKRPTFLPEQVLARKMEGGGEEEDLCPLTIYAYRVQGVTISYPYVDEVNQYLNIADEGGMYVHFLSSDPAVDFTLWTMTLGGFPMGVSRNPDVLQIYPSQTAIGFRWALVYAPSLEGSQVFAASGQGYTCNITLTERVGYFPP